MASLGTKSSHWRDTSGHAPVRWRRSVTGLRHGIDVVSQDGPRAGRAPCLFPGLSWRRAIVTPPGHDRIRGRREERRWIGEARGGRRGGEMALDPAPLPAERGGRRGAASGWLAVYLGSRQSSPTRAPVGGAPDGCKGRTGQTATREGPAYEARQPGMGMLREQPGAKDPRTAGGEIRARRRGGGVGRKMAIAPLPRQQAAGGERLGRRTRLSRPGAAAAAGSRASVKAGQAIGSPAGDDETWPQPHPPRAGPRRGEAE